MLLKGLVINHMHDIDTPSLRMLKQIKLIEGFRSRDVREADNDYQ